MQDIPMFGSTLYHLLFFFFIYSFIGWCLEEAFVAVDTGKIVNRGFLNGPVCPIYGCGALLVILLLSKVSDNLILLYIASVLLTSALEFTGGIALEKLFHTRWWDYSAQPLNLLGHVCLKFSLLWGIGCVFLVKLIHPALEKVLSLFPAAIGNVVLVVMILIFAADLFLTVKNALKLNQYLSELNRISDLIRSGSDQLGTAISKEALEMKERYDKTMETYHKSTARLIKAFPRMKSLQYDNILSEMKEKIRQVRGK